MPSVIGTDSLSGINVAANYLKAAASTQFGTRKLVIIKLAIANVYTNYATANSLFSKSVRALQQTAEVYAVGTPVDDTTDYFQAIVAYDTQWAGDSASPQQGNTGQDGTGYGVLETAIAAGNGGVSTTITEVTL